MTRYSKNFTFYEIGMAYSKGGQATACKPHTDLQIFACGLLIF